MKRKAVQIWAAMIAAVMLSGCGAQGIAGNQSERDDAATQLDDMANGTVQEEEPLAWTEEITNLEDGLSAVRYMGDYGFDEFLEQGGAVSDSEVIHFLTSNVILGAAELELNTQAFACSTISAQTEQGGYLFGRNFDWNQCDGLIVGSRPDNGYASISTVNVDFIRQGTSGLTGLALRNDGILTMAALYAPLDGMNEKGLAVSVNMIQDSARIEQDAGKPDLTTTTAVRLLLDKAADVEEAVELLEQYDLHGSMGMMVHFALADAGGKSVVVEYIDNEMVVTETPVVTNFYLAEGEKHGIGTSQSHERYEILMSRLEEEDTLTAEDVRDALSSVSKKNFGEFESTEWSIVFDQDTMEARYYHREDYTKQYLFAMP